MLQRRPSQPDPTFAPSRIVLASLLLLCALPPLAGQELDEDEETARPPGLIARFEAQDRAVTGQSADLAFDWAGQAPDLRLPAGEFTAEWHGHLQVRSPGEYRFHAYLLGEIRVEVAGMEALNGSRDEPAWLDGPPLRLEFGEHPLRVRFRKVADQARLFFCWSSDSFDREPVPSHVLFADAGAEAAAAAAIERGKSQFQSLRCQRCHPREGDPPVPAAPSLARAGRDIDPRWLSTWLHDPASLSATSRMPVFGFSPAEAEEIAAFLQSVATGEANRAAEWQATSEDRRLGRKLFTSLGCLACHRHGELGQDADWGGGDLTQLGRKRTAGWVFQWLKASDRAGEKPDSARRMPVFRLSDAEAKQLAGFLVDPSPPGPVRRPASASAAARGRKLVEAARCAACHEIPGVAAPPTVKLADTSSTESCLSPQPDRAAFRPAYSRVDADAIRAWLASCPPKLSAESSFERGRRLLVQKGCISCHPRDGGAGLGEVAAGVARLESDWTGQSEALVPPSLSAVGDKLHDAALKTAARGDREAVRMPWLSVRMPRYAHSPQDEEVLLAYLIAHDRIPPREGSAPAAPPADSAHLLAGHTLVGGRGFSCVACHRVGSFEPRNVALGTRGSDLLRIGERMRKDFFLRWVKSPIRIVTDMEMPSYERPVEGILAGSLPAQREALWAALNDPQFQAPLDVSVVEQMWTLHEGDRPRILRDVFTLPGQPDAYVPRAFAVGFPNRHNVLFDLDTFRVRQWWLGDFARQRAQGKSWFWDAAGVPVVTGLGSRPEIVLRHSDGAILLPQVDRGTNGRLRAYAAREDRIDLQYALTFRVADKPVAIDVDERWSPLNGKNGGGWSRRIAVAQPPQEHQAFFIVPSFTRRVGIPSVSTADRRVQIDLPNAAAVEAISLTANGIDVAFVVNAPPPPAALPPPPAVVAEAVAIDTVPGYDGIRLPLPRSIMPTAFGWTADGALAVSSLKGEIYLLRDKDGDGLEETLEVFEDGLAAPFGLLGDGSSLLVAHKPEVLRLRDTDGDARADVREVVATGWGYGADYHDWTCGIVRDAMGRLYVGLGSDYAQAKRPRESALWRGKVLQIGSRGEITPVGHGFRYPTGLAIDAAGRIFISDNQGVQNTFNEINLLVPGGHYGVPSLLDDPQAGPVLPPALAVPHPWTRSVNGIFFLPHEGPGAKVLAPFAGHGIGCEYDARFLIRFTIDQVGDTVQGAVYPFSRPAVPEGTPNFEGTICGTVSPRGDIYIGCMHDSGWLGGPNVGSIVRLRPNSRVPVGLKTIRAVPGGLVLEFTAPVDATAAADSGKYSLSGCTRVWQGTYATPDSNRHTVPVQQASVAADGRSVRLQAALKAGHVYEVTCGDVGPPHQKTLWPATGHYTAHKLPE